MRNKVLYGITTGEVSKVEYRYVMTVLLLKQWELKGNIRTSIIRRAVLLNFQS